MTTIKRNTRRLKDSLPAEFNFYNTGTVRAQQGLQDDFWTDDAHAVAFKISGDLKGVFVLRVEFKEDVSMYHEMGNVFASHLVTELKRTRGLDLWISPPYVLNPKRATRLLALSRDHHDVERRTYLHLMNGRTVPIDTWLLSQEVAQEFGDQAFDVEDALKVSGNA